jgi:hypothetical protein
MCFRSKRGCDWDTSSHVDWIRLTVILYAVCDAGAGRAYKSGVKSSAEHTNSRAPLGRTSSSAGPTLPSSRSVCSILPHKSLLALSMVLFPSMYIPYRNRSINVMSKPRYEIRTLRALDNATQILFGIARKPSSPLEFERTRDNMIICTHRCSRSIARCQFPPHSLGPGSYLLFEP